MKKYPVIISLLLIFIFLVSYFIKPSTPQQPLHQKLSLESFAGKWYINMSTFPMWLKGDKTDPTFNYSIEDKDGKQVLHGDVQYIKKGKLRHIEGSDESLNEYNTAFLWRGKGVLKLFKSKWAIVAYNEPEKWAIMHFQKTLFTPEGYDVFSRQKKPDEAAIKNVQQALSELRISGKLHAIPQE